MPANNAFESYQQWASTLSHLLHEYASWKRSHNMDVSGVEKALKHTESRIRLIITGEFGRGKTEFVNTLLTDHCGQRLLPVHVGQATMTPLEIFHDASSSPYIKLLPIETRLNKRSISMLKTQLEQWEHHDLNTKNPESMRLLFQEIAKTKPVTLAVAEQLGFDIHFLDACEDHPDHVYVPAWQHALINIDFPKFKQGLCVVDTPGFNALGMESTLSEDILQEGHAHLHVLSVETGVTASDYSFWKNSILPASTAQHMPLFALINKLDLLDSNEEPALTSLSRIKRLGAKRLDLTEKQFFALSAKFANQSMVNQDQTLRKRSGYDFFCEHFFHMLATERIKRLQHGLLKPLVLELENQVASHALEIKRLDKDMKKLINTQDDVEKNYLKTKEHISDEQQRIDKKHSLYDENIRDIDLSYEHIMYIFSDNQFNTHKDRGLSLLSNNDVKDVAAEVKKARNVMLAGMRLDMKRIAMDIKVLNNSMRALYSDLESQFEPREISVDYFADYIEQIESATINSNGASRSTFETEVLKELNNSFRKQRKLIKTWYDSHLKTVKEPLDLARTNLEERQTLAKQMARKITDRKEHLTFTKERLPVAKDDLAKLSRLRASLNQLI